MTYDNIATFKVSGILGGAFVIRPENELAEEMAADIRASDGPATLLVFKAPEESEPASGQTCSADESNEKLMRSLVAAFDAFWKEFLK